MITLLCLWAAQWWLAAPSPYSNEVLRLNPPGFCVALRISANEKMERNGKHYSLAQFFLKQQKTMLFWLAKAKTDCCWGTKVRLGIRWTRKESIDSWHK